MTDSREQESVAGERGRDEGRGGMEGKRREQMTEERRRGGEHGRLRNDFNESTESPADTLDMTPGD